MKKYLGETSHKRKHHPGDPFLRPILFAENRLPEVDVSLCIPKMAIGLYFSKWRNEELFVHLNDMLRELIQATKNRNKSCSVAIIDSNSVKTTQVGGL